MNTTPLFSVVIGYRNWGGERLRLAVESHLRSTIADRVEIIVSDFGSDNGRRAETILAGMDVQCVYTKTDEPWSRSRALNAGVAVARGEFILAWDADILCAPELHEELHAHFLAQPNSAYPLQCRDLAEDYDETKIRTLLEKHDGFPMDELRENSAWRPRWGMGIAAYRREHFDLVRGYDERFVIWGGEDRDLMNRFSRAGIAVRWADSPYAEIFHIFHGSSLDEASRTVEGQAAVTRNHDFVQRDRTIFRNLSQPRYLKTQKPLVSVVVATCNRGAYLKETVPTILNQTLRDLELIVVDDGSTDDTQDVLKSFDDDRLVVIRQENAGVAAARNAGIRRARGHFMLVHDDDDLMLPNRLEVQLEALPENCGGSYGGWVDFNGDTGELVTVNSGKDFSAASIAYAGKVLLHPTVMTTHWIAQRVPYDERYKGGSDFNWMMTISANGAKLCHTGNVHILRRLHGASLTSGGSGQKHASRASARASHSGMGHAALEELRALGRSAASRHCVQEDDLEALYQYLPDRLKKQEYQFSVVLDAKGARDMLKRAAETNDVSITMVSPVFSGGVSIIGLYRLLGHARDQETCESYLGAHAASSVGKWGFGPVGESRRPPVAALPATTIFEFHKRIGSQMPDTARSLLDIIAEQYSVTRGALVVVKGARKQTIRIGSAERIVRRVDRNARHVGSLQTSDGILPVYQIDCSESTAAGLRKVGQSWAARNLTLIVHEPATRVGSKECA